MRRWQSESSPIGLAKVFSEAPMEMGTIIFLDERSAQR